MKHLEYLLVGILTMVLAVGSVIYIPYVLGFILAGNVKFVRDRVVDKESRAQVWWLGMIMIIITFVGYVIGSVVVQGML